MKALAVCVVALALAACGLPGSSVVMLTEQDANSVANLRSGQRLDVALAANPSTGYTWQVVSSDPAIIPEVGEPGYKADDPGRLGGGGTMILHFQAAASGRTLLKLGYLRPWDTTTPPAKTFQVTVVVR